VAPSFSSGIYEAICFLSFGKVFTAFQTGNVVFLGLGAAGTRPPAGLNSVTVIISLAAFAAGAVLAIPILESFDGNVEVEDSRVIRVWPRRVSIGLGVALVVQAGFLAVWTTTSSPAHLAYILIALGAFPMGMQMNAIRSMHVPGISTTAFTATFISLASSIASWSLTAAAARRLAGALVGMAAGAFLGDWMLSHAHAYAPVVPLVVIGLVIGIASGALKQGARGRRHERACPSRWCRRHRAARGHRSGASHPAHTRRTVGIASDTDALIKHILEPVGLLYVEDHCLLEEQRRFGLDAPRRQATARPGLGAGRGQGAGRW
jgi:uncharacterized membrane protein YoaK (UPF0700 family)